MPLVIPRFLQARDLLSATASAGSLGTTTGTITWGTAVQMAVAGTGSGTWKACEFTGEPNLQLFMPSDLGVANYQNEFEDWTFVVREITPVNGAGVLTAMWAATDYFRFDYVYRARNLSTGAGTRLVVVGARGQLTNPFGPGENVQQVTIRPIGFPVYVGVSTDTPPF